MSIYLDLAPALHRNLLAHLMPPDSDTEQGAFLFVRNRGAAADVVFEVIDSVLLRSDQFASQEGYYLELNDGTRAELIKRAHDLGASLVELHSHLGDHPAAFSFSDRAGLKDTVPHMRWRLMNRPYLALVVAASGFDALAWIDSPRVPVRLDGIRVGVDILHPTNLSLKGWS